MFKELTTTFVKARAPRINHSVMFLYFKTKNVVSVDLLYDAVVS